MEATVAQRTRTVRMISQEMIKDYLIHKTGILPNRATVKSPGHQKKKKKADCKQ